VSQEAGKCTVPLVVLTHELDESQEPQESRKERFYRVGPVGYEHGKAVTLFLPLGTDLRFSYVSQSSQWTAEEFEVRLASQDLELERREIYIPQDEAILVPTELAIGFPMKPECRFICIAYTPGVARLNVSDMEFEDKYVIPFMRFSWPATEINNWKSY